MNPTWAFGIENETNQLVQSELCDISDKCGNDNEICKR